MSVGRGFVIKDHLSVEECDEIINDYKLMNKICIRVILIRLLLLGKTIKDASFSVGVSRQTGSRWLKRYNEEGYEGLIPKFGGGAPGQLTIQNKEDLKEILINKKSNYTIVDVVKLIKEKFKVDFSYNRTWTLVRKEFVLWYTKPNSQAHEKPDNHKDILKKN